MLTPADDYPLHQTAEPMAFAGTDRNFYDRYFFNALPADGSFFIAVALGVYPQLDIMDAAISAVVGDKQYNLHASKHMQGDRLNLCVGPISIEIEKPLERATVRIVENDGPITGRLTMTARHFPIEEPRFIRRVGTRCGRANAEAAPGHHTWHAGSQLGHSAHRCRGPAAADGRHVEPVLLALDTREFCAACSLFSYQRR